MMKLGIIGTGAIGEAIAQALGKSATCLLYDKVAERARSVAKATGSTAVESLDALIAAQPDWIVLAVKPQDAQTAAAQIKLPAGQKLVSCLAGVTVDTLASLFPGALVARFMPNLLIRTGQGSMALTAHPKMSGDQVEELQKWLGQLGAVYLVDEPMLEKLTALIGSGPAFLFMAAEAFMDGAIAIGIAPHQACSYIAQLFSGIAVALKEKHPAQWRQAICSPGGTTIEGVRALEAAGLRSAFIEAIIATYERGQELKS